MTGYKSPPEEYKFKKGQGGRKPGAINFTHRLAKRAAEELQFKDCLTAKERNALVADALIDKLIKSAMQGNLRALQYIIDRVDGPLLQKYEAVNYNVDMESQKAHLKNLSADELKQLRTLFAKMYEERTDK